MAFEPPLTSTPVSHLPRSIDVAECGRSPTLVNVTVAPALIRMRDGPKLYSTLLAPILTVSAPATIGPVGPATVCGGGGGHRDRAAPSTKRPTPHRHTRCPAAGCRPSQWRRIARRPLHRTQVAHRLRNRSGTARAPCPTWHRARGNCRRVPHGTRGRPP